MGTCFNNPEKIVNEDIDRELIELNRSQSHNKHVVLIGLPNSGKSTIMKQLRKIHFDGKNDNWGSHNDNNDIYDSNNCSGRQIGDALISEMKYLCLKSINFDIELETKQNEEYRKWFLDETHNDPSEDIDKQYVTKIKSLWRDKGIRSTFNICNTNNDHCFGDLEYFIDKIDVIFNNTCYQQMHLTPFEDFVRIKTESNGIVSQTVTSCIGYRNPQRFIYQEIGDSKGERYMNKWMQLTETDASIFIIDISKYEIVDDGFDPINESLELFRKLMRMESREEIVLFFNKYDVLLNKLQDVDVADIRDFRDDFPEDLNPRDATAICEWVYGKFNSIYQEYSADRYRYVHYHRVCAFIGLKVHC